MLWLKTFYEAVGLPKLNGVAINGDFCEPPRLLLIRAADIDPIDNVAVRPALSHRRGILPSNALSMIRCEPNFKTGLKGCLFENENGLAGTYVGYLTDKMGL